MLEKKLEALFDTIINSFLNKTARFDAANGLIALAIFYLGISIKKAGERVSEELYRIYSAI